MAFDRDLFDDPAKKQNQQTTEATGASAGTESNSSKSRDDSRASISDFLNEASRRMHEEVYLNPLSDPFAAFQLKKPLEGMPKERASNSEASAHGGLRSPWDTDSKPGPDLRPGSDFRPQPPDLDRKVPPEALDPPIKPKPEIHPETKPEQIPDSKPSGSVIRDGNRLHIDYPGGVKSRDVVLDSNGKAQEIITKDAQGTMHLLRKNDSWFAKIQGMELQMPGKIEANDRGELTFEMGQGVFRREKPDGTSVQEKTNADGSRMSFYDNSQVEKLTRKDGSSVQVSADGRSIVETLPNSNRAITWTKIDASTWTSDSQPPQERKNFKVESNGNSSWDGPDGLKFVVGGDGTMMVQGDGQAKIQLDEQNRVKSIDYGNKQRSFEYFDKSNEIQKTTVTDKEKNSSSTFTRESSGSKQWRTDSGQTWNGDIRLGPGGVYSYKPEGSSVTEADKDGKWASMWPDGKLSRDVIGADGSRLSYDSNGRLNKALANDGTSAEISDSKMTITNPRSGERVTWTKENEAWRSDSPKIPGIKKNLQINEKCELSFTSEDGSTQTIRPDGKTVLTRKDGVQLELNEQQQIDRITKGDSVRTIDRAADGSISRVIDSNKTGERLLLDRKQNDGINSVELSKDGDLLIKRNDLSSTTELANFNSVSRNKNGEPVQMVNPKGDVRNISWSGEGSARSVSEIQDSRKTSRGDVTEVWTRKPGTNDFVSVGKNGKEKIRENVQLTPDGSGDYTYKNKDGGKDKLAKLGSDGGGDSALSENVADARDNLLDELKEKLPEANYKRFQEMMQNFEKRMGDRAYLRKLAGVKGAESIDDEVQKDVQGTYDNLRQMVSKGDDGTFYDQKTRVKLAENFMFHAMEPTTIDQGPSSPRDENGHGTCWISSGQIWGMTQHPGAMADYLKQVSLGGQVTTKNSGEKDATPKTYSFSSRLLSFPAGNQESKWTIETATTMWREEPGMKTEIIGDRSPVSKIFDYTLPVLSGSRAEFDVDGGTYDTFDFVGKGHTRGTREILYMVTGDVPVDLADSANQTNGHLLNNNFGQSMAEKGTVLNYEPGHLKSQTVRQVDGKWYLIQDNQHGEKEDRVIAEITNIERWAKGDKSAQRSLDLPTLPLLHRKTYVGSGAADALGAVTPRRSSNSVSNNNSVPQNRNYQSSAQYTNRNW